MSVSLATRCPVVGAGVRMSRHDRPFPQVLQPVDCRENGRVRAEPVEAGRWIAGAGFATMPPMNSTMASDIPAESEDIPAEGLQSGDESPRKASDGTVLMRLAIALVGTSAAFYLLQVLGDFLRPVLVAVLLVYAIWPLHARLKRGMSSGVSLLIIGSGLALVSLAIGWMAFANASELWKDLPRYESRAERLTGQLRGYAGRVLPAPIRARLTQGDPIRVPLERMGEYIHSLFGIFSGFVAWAVLVGLYVVFLIVEASGFQRAIRRAFPPDRAARILEVVDSINEAVIEYLSVKVKVNLLVAIPATLLMLGFGLRAPCSGACSPSSRGSSRTSAAASPMPCRWRWPRSSSSRRSGPPSSPRRCSRSTSSANM